GLNSPLEVSLEDYVRPTAEKIYTTKEERVEVPWNMGIMKRIETTLPFSSGYTSWEKDLHLIASKKINVNSLITHCFPLGDWSKAFSLVTKGQAIKTLFIA
ncbi:unnamed protein product, partial [marine sediment metagenome]